MKSYIGLYLDYPFVVILLSLYRRLISEVTRSIVTELWPTAHVMYIPV